jgi:LmbE family N-acetylglucosaminyl deacetylase
MKKILVIAAHPDDEVLGCGGTISKLVQQGSNVYTLLLGEGQTARGKVSQDEIDTLNKEMHKANEVMGVKKIFWLKFPDNRFDQVALLDIVKEIEKIIDIVKPDTIFTHHFGDLNIDHQITYKAVLIATRPLPEKNIKEIYSFEVPSSTEWNGFSASTAFIPNVFIDISNTIDKKIEAMTKYKSELKDYPHPRSLKHIRELAVVNGSIVGLNYCEAFVLIRRIINNNHIDQD